ncbi:MAG: DUF975 family protein [Hornefia sp.]|nr:DUF975 family protein [Hornefia sp.]
MGWFVEFGHIENRFLSALMNITNVINSEIPWRLIKEYFKSLALNLICILSIAVGGLLLIVPGFLAAYGFSQAKFILMEDLSKGVIQCIKESWVLMDGKKADLFLIHLTFIGWRALSAIQVVKSLIPS